MRVYTRGVEQGLLIGETVQVNVLEIQTDRVRLAIIDPDAAPSYREETLYLTSRAAPCASIRNSGSIFDSYDGMTIEDNDSRLIPMA